MNEENFQTFTVYYELDKHNIVAKQKFKLRNPHILQKILLSIENYIMYHQNHR